MTEKPAIISRSAELAMVFAAASRGADPYQNMQPGMVYHGASLDNQKMVSNALAAIAKMYETLAGAES